MRLEVILIATCLPLSVATHASAQPRPTPAKATETNCWPEAKEATNEKRVAGSWPKVPKRLRSEKVTSSVLAMKLCIDPTGAVAKVLTLKSSGNQKIDEFYRSSLSTWKYAALQAKGQTLPSVAFFTATFLPKPDG